MGTDTGKVMVPWVFRRLLDCRLGRKGLLEEVAASTTSGPGFRRLGDSLVDQSIIGSPVLLPEVGKVEEEATARRLGMGA